jgi:ribosomal protein S16
MADYYVVHVTPPEDTGPFKVFEANPIRAKEHAEAALADGAEKAVVYFIVANDVRAAKAGVEMGEGTLHFSPTPKASPCQIEEAAKAARDRKVLEEIGFSYDSISGKFS